MRMPSFGVVSPNRPRMRPSPATGNPETVALRVPKVGVGELGGRQHDGLTARGLPAPRRLVRVARGLEQAVAVRRDQDEPVLLELLEALGARVLADVRLHLVERTLRAA